METPFTHAAFKPDAAFASAAERFFQSFLRPSASFLWNWASASVMKLVSGLSRSLQRASIRSWSCLSLSPSGGVAFGDVALPWYMRQGDEPLASTRGHLYDHFALSVTDLDAWVDKLRTEGIDILAEPYALGDTRAVMITGPSQEAIELVEGR